jgi:hypothetical protein
MQIKDSLSGGSIVILIDCCDNAANADVIKVLTDNILEKVSKIPDLAAVILSSYDTQEHFLTDNLYYTNSNALFYDSQPIPSIREWYIQTLISTSSSSINTLTTIPRILHKKWHCPQFVMFNELQLEYYINHITPHVQNIYFLGVAWSVCVKSRPIGWDNISRLIKYKHLKDDINIYTISDCLLDVVEPLEYTDHPVLFFPDLHNDSNCEHIQDTVFKINYK